MSAAFAAAQATAAVTATTDGFVVKHTRAVQSSTISAYRALIDWGSWWSGAHSWSGSAANIALDAVADGCLCERWAGGEVAHGHVIAAILGKRRLLDAPLGPLQAMPVVARLSFTLEPAAQGSVVVVEMRVSGAGTSNLAAPIDAVLNEAADRLMRRIDAGRP